MLMLVMGNFGAYTIRDVMDMPYCHFVDLYNMAEKRETLHAVAVFSGRAMWHDKDHQQRNLAVVNGRLKSAVPFKDIVSEEAKKRAEEIARGI